MAHSVLIVMGSDSDLEQITPAWKVLEASARQEFEVAVILGAPLAPDRVVAIGAICSGHLPASSSRPGGRRGATPRRRLAAHHAFPVVAVPIVTGTLPAASTRSLSAVQMPRRSVPIARSVRIGGARNFRLLHAAAILSSTDPRSRQKKTPSDLPEEQERTANAASG
jgi:phosphoribosylcarboxyaminoimidazole (NCAIR) mutase